MLEIFYDRSFVLKRINFAIDLQLKDGQLECSISNSVYVTIPRSQVLFPLPCNDKGGKGERA